LKMDFLMCFFDDFPGRARCGAPYSTPIAAGVPALTPAVIATICRRPARTKKVLCSAI
jgi:hypothetical protein